jgi:hypothetical protein
MTALIEDVTRKHDLLRTELPAYGFSVPHGHTASLTQALGKGQEGRKMAFERLLGDVKEACVEVLLQTTSGSAVCSCSCLPCTSVDSSPNLLQLKRPSQSSVYAAVSTHTVSVLSSMGIKQGQRAHCRTCPCTNQVVIGLAGSKSTLHTCL